jgi:FKBP-type peptidyl-prolyl cis-trans isomerase FkpA
MKRDTVGGDTSGIYYQTILPGKANTSYAYPDSISFVFSLSSFDGSYTSPDTTYNHYASYVGHITTAALPYGLQLVIHDVLKRGGSMRVLIPSHLGYGISGYGSGSSSNLNSKIAGNQCLDYYVHAITNQPAYDDQVIRSFITANNYTGYQKTASGLWYLVHTPGIGTDIINDNSNVTTTYTGYLLNTNIFDQYNTVDGSGISKDIDAFLPGVQEGLKSFATTGAYISFILPSNLAYGALGTTGVPVNSVVRFDMRVTAVTP